MDILEFDNALIESDIMPPQNERYLCHFIYDGVAVNVIPGKLYPIGGAFFQHGWHDYHIPRWELTPILEAVKSSR